MSKYHPPYLLAHFADTSGCGYHRIMRPVEMMARTGYACGRCDGTLWPLENLVNLSPDIVIFQRQHEDRQIESIRDYRKVVPNAFFVYEIDDILSDLPDYSLHRHYIPGNVDEKMKLAVAECDAVSVTTRALANHIKGICGDKTDVRIIPNMLSRDDVDRFAEMRQSKPKTKKKRIGWAGGAAHVGDLELIIPAMQEFGDKVEWVFMALKPEVDVPIEFHEGCPPNAYLQKIASLNLDLMLAPLQDNLFNRCKSNLKLLESGATGCPVIASNIQPYEEGRPPVYAYAETPNDWIKAIGRFIQDDDVGGAALTDWVRKHYLYEDHMDDRVKAWAPHGHEVFVPKRTQIAVNSVVIVTPKAPKTTLKYPVVDTFEKAWRYNAADILYLRDETNVTNNQIDRMRERLSSGKFASVTPWSNDSGACGFPQNTMFSPIEGGMATKLDVLVTKMFTAPSLEIPFPAGPAIMLSRKVVEMIGVPDLSGGLDHEAALSDWGVMAHHRGFPNMAATDVYVNTTVR